MMCLSDANRVSKYCEKCLTDNFNIINTGDKNDKKLDKGPLTFGKSCYAGS